MEVGKAALVAVKSVAVDVGKKLIEKAMQPKSTKKVESIVSKYIDNTTKGSAVAVQDLVIRLYGSGLKNTIYEWNKKVIINNKMTSEILNFAEKPIVDESIQEYEYHEYEPQARTNLNSAQTPTPLLWLTTG